MNNDKKPAVTWRGLTVIGVCTTCGLFAIFYYLYKAGIAPKQLLEIAFVAAVSFAMVGYIIVVTLRAGPNTAGGQTFGKRAIGLMRLFSLLSAALILLMGYDFIVSPVNEATATVLGKTKDLQGGLGITVSEDGAQSYRHVEKDIYRMLEKGDIVRVKKSRIFGNWKKAVVIRNGHEIQTFKSTDDLWMLCAGLFFAVPLLSFLISTTGLLPPLLRPFSFIMLILIPIIEAIVFIFWVAFLTSC